MERRGKLMDREEYIFGIDVGGTKIAAGLVKQDGEIILSKKIAADTFRPQGILYQLQELIPDPSQ